MQINFTRKKLETYEADYWSDPDETPVIWHHLPETEGAPASIRDDGQIILIREPFAGFVDYTMELRRVVPFAAAL